MGRHKAIRDYTIKLSHPVLGDFYYNYNNDGWDGRDNYFRFYFTKDLKKVRTWKSKETVKGQIDLYVNIFQGRKATKHVIILRLNDAQANLINNVGVNIVRKKPYLEIHNIISEEYLEKTKNDIEKIKITVSENITGIEKMLKSNTFNAELWGRVKNLKKDTEKLTDYYSYVKDSEHPIFMDIADASFGFRFLKLKTLKNFQPGVDEDEDEEEELEMET